ncbi:hypothetical protein M3Y94_01205900 [Aphelenchoides besseyi]|nr:hypothetical protein M3Y94_01205900 [Aphelenchoides besseyi]KAI6228481.1 hypothetical protein M3Y95_00626900 [Aphelenchoides besseyi]
MSTIPSTESNVKFIQSIMGQGRVNQLGGNYINGRPLPMDTRIEIIRRSEMGIKPCDISRELKISHGAVSKILNRYAATGSISPGQIGGNPRQRVTIQSVEKPITMLKEAHADWGAQEIRQHLIDSGVCTKTTAPTVSAINRHLKKTRSFTTNRVNGGPLDSPTTSTPTVPLQETASSNQPVQKSNFSIDNILATNEDRGNHSLSDDRSTSSTPTTRVRTNFAAHQVDILERAYNEEPYPNPIQKEQLALATGLDENKIQVWFSNRRARQRKILGNNPAFTAEQFLRNAAAQQFSPAASSPVVQQQQLPYAGSSPVLSTLFPHYNIPIANPILCFQPDFSLLQQLNFLANQYSQKKMP